MVAMKVLMVVACAAVAAAVPSWTDLRAHSVGSNAGSDNYLYKQLPRTLNDANEQGWVSPPEESRDSVTCSLPYTTLCADTDPSLCLLYDQNGFIAGAEFGIVKSNAAGAYPFANKAFFASKKRFGYDSWIFTTFFVDQATLNNGGRTSVAETGLGVWVQNGRNTQLVVPVAEKDANVTGSQFNKQVCSAGQGVRYLYNTTTATTCDSTTPIVGIYNAGTLVGFAFQSFGRTTPKGARYYETLSTTTYQQSLATTAPTCLNTWATNYGLVSIHVFFTSTPWLACC